MRTGGILKGESGSGRLLCFNAGAAVLSGNTKGKLENLWTKLKRQIS